MLQQCFALVADPAEVDPGLLSTVAGVLQIQVSRDFAQAPPQGWGISATVVAAPVGHSSPNGSIPIYITSKVSDPSAFGYHTAQNGQPLAVVQLVPETAQWAFYASHELLEMLVDPFGKTLHPGPSIDPQRQGTPVSYLVEVCDPVQDPRLGYTINGFLVSNFVLQSFYQPQLSGSRYDFAGRLSGPLSLAPGGCITWGDSQVGRWIQYAYGDAQVSEGPALGSPPPGMSAREFVHGELGRHLRSEPLPLDVISDLSSERRLLERAREHELEPALKWLELHQHTNRPGRRPRARRNALAGARTRPTVDSVRGDSC